MVWYTESLFIRIENHHSNIRKDFGKRTRYTYHGDKVSKLLENEVPP
jgi:hypothetical protein